MFSFPSSHQVEPQLLKQNLRCSNCDRKKTREGGRKLNCTCGFEPVTFNAYTRTQLAHSVDHCHHQIERILKIMRLYDLERLTAVTEVVCDWSNTSFDLAVHIHM